MHQIVINITWDDLQSEYCSSNTSIEYNIRLNFTYDNSSTITACISTTQDGQFCIPRELHGCVNFYNNNNNDCSETSYMATTKENTVQWQSLSIEVIPKNCQGYLYSYSVPVTIMLGGSQLQGRCIIILI